MRLSAHRMPFSRSGSGSWWLGFVFDGDDEDGDPSGLTLNVIGLQIGIYWPMHQPFEISWSLGSRLHVGRWEKDVSELE